MQKNNTLDNSDPNEHMSGPFRVIVSGDEYFDATDFAKTAQIDALVAMPHEIRNRFWEPATDSHEGSVELQILCMFEVVLYGDRTRPGKPLQRNCRFDVPLYYRGEWRPRTVWFDALVLAQCGCKSMIIINLDKQCCQ